MIFILKANLTKLKENLSQVEFELKDVLIFVKTQLNHLSERKIWC